MCKCLYDDADFDECKKNQKEKEEMQKGQKVGLNGKLVGSAVGSDAFRVHGLDAKETPNKG